MFATNVNDKVAMVLLGHGKEVFLIWQESQKLKVIRNKVTKCTFVNTGKVRVWYFNILSIGGTKYAYISELFIILSH